VGLGIAQHQGWTVLHRSLTPLIAGWLPPSVRLQLLMLIGLAALPPTALLIYYELRDPTMRVASIEAQVTDLAEALAAANETMLARASVLLTALTEGDDVLVGGGERCARRLNELQSQLPTGWRLAVFDRSGRSRCLTRDASARIDIGDRPSFRQALSADGPVVGTVVDGRGTGNRLLPILTALRDDHGAVRGVGAVAVPIEWLSGVVDRFGLPAETAIQIVDRDGNLLVQAARSGAPVMPIQRWLGASLDADEVANRLTIDGALVAVTGAPATGIRIAVQTPLDRLRIDAHHKLLAEVGLILLVLVATYAMARTYARRTIADRLADLKRLGDRLRQGDLSARLPPISGKDEIAELGLVLNHMAMELERRVSELRAREAAYRHDATHDALTGLANRRAFLAELDRRIGSSPWQGGGFALLLVDLDHFKDINDGLGHDAGDGVLCALGQRLRSSLREGDLVARLAGDEFAILASAGTDDESNACELALRIGKTMQAPIDYAGRPISITASIGVAVFPTDRDTAADLLRAADIALYTAKLRGSDRAVHFEAAMTVARGRPIMRRAAG
jgi:diguanylate cyclase (GGDEF)-like protein